MKQNGPSNCLQAAGVIASPWSCLSAAVTIHSPKKHWFIPISLLPSWINYVFPSYLLGNYVHLGKISDGSWESGFHSHRKILIPVCKPLALVIHGMYISKIIQKFVSSKDFMQFPTSLHLSLQVKMKFLKLIMFKISKLLVLQK